MCPGGGVGEGGQAAGTAGAGRTRRRDYIRAHHPNGAAIRGFSLRARAPSMRKQACPAGSPSRGWSWWRTGRGQFGW